MQRPLRDGFGVLGLHAGHRIRHLRTQLSPYDLDAMLPFRSPLSIQEWSARLILQDPGPRKRTVLYVLQYLPHVLTYVLVDDLRAGDVVAELSGVLH
jgi:hypothetical protein